MKKLILLLIISILSLSNLKAQTSEFCNMGPTNFYNDFVKPANFIFEASIVKVDIVTEGERFFKVNHLKVHKVFKGNLKSYSLIEKYEIDSSSKANYLNHKGSEKKFNNYDWTGWTSMYFGNINNGNILSNDASFYLEHTQFTYYLNFDTYTYSDKNMLIKEYLLFGNIPRLDTNEVTMYGGYKDLVKVKDLYDTLLRFPDIKLSYDDGSVFKQMTAQEWLNAHPGMRPNWRNIAVPIIIDTKPETVDSALLKQNDDAKKRFEQYLKASNLKKLSPKENRKNKKAKNRSSASLTFTYDNEYYSENAAFEQFLEFDSKNKRKHYSHFSRIERLEFLA